MKCYLEFVTTPTADTPGTLLMLHFDNRRYLIGNVSEGMQRACNERGVGLRKVSSILLTGRTEWATLGGLLGMVLELADIKREARDAAQAVIAEQGTVLNKPKKQQYKVDLAIENLHLDIHGAPNLNHMIAASRRFIFRTGMPMNAIEHGRAKVADSTTSWSPTWEDDRIRVWALPILPSCSETSVLPVSSPRKRTYHEIDGTEPHAISKFPAEFPDHDPFLEMRKAVVSQMFNSKWRLDNLLPQSLSQVRMPAALFVRDPETKQLSQYTGPMPGGNESVPDITVWVREPWPGALTEHLPPTKPAPEALSYIIRNHPQRGKFLPEKAAKFGVPKGPLWSLLANGNTVQTLTGKAVTPDMVLAPGKQGGGVAIVDLPSVDYVESLISRPEWQAKEVMDGVEAMVWLLGAGVTSDTRLLSFQQEMSQMKHIVSSPDCCPNILALEAAATNALRHNSIDSTIFPKLHCSSVHMHSKVNGTDNVSRTVPATTFAQRGHVLTLEPKVELLDNDVKAPLDLVGLQSRITEEFQTLDTSGTRLNSDVPSDEVESWQRTMPHGDAEIIVLGTGSSHPSRCRNVSGTLVRIPGCGSYLLDCGEGTLGTLRRMFPKSELDSILRDLKMVWISHMHADHHLGLASIVKAWSKATEELEYDSDPDLSDSECVSARSTSAYHLAVVSDTPMLHWLHEYGSAEELGLSRVIPLATVPSKIGSDLTIEQGTDLWYVKPAWISERDSRSTGDFLEILNLQSLNTVFVNHCRGAQAVSITFKNGVKVSYSGDCRPSANFAIIGRESHILIHEATFEDNMRSEALAKKHSTAGEALIVAGEMKARVCLLTHFSQRYPEMPQLGVPVRKGVASPTVQQLANILEEAVESQPAASMSEEAEPVELDNGGATHPLRPTKESSTAELGIGILNPGSMRRSSSGHLDLINEDDIRNMVDRSGMKVLFAFDYMRIKLKDVPRLVKKQVLLREMYDKGVAKDVLADTNMELDTKAVADTEGLREQKKKTRADKLTEQKTANKERAHASEEKWAHATKAIAERHAED